LEQSLHRPSPESIREAIMTTWKIHGIVRWLVVRFSDSWRRNRLEPDRFNGRHSKKTELIQKILDIEWQMFSRLRVSESSRKDHGERLYRAMRRKIHAGLPVNVLESYLQDLRQAQREGRNPIMEKFDRREGKRLPLKVSPLIPRIVELECAWKRAMDAKSPRFKPARDEEAFRLVITSELETYSDKTLDLYYRAVLDARRARRNLVEERYRDGASPTSLSGAKRKKKESLVQSGRLRNARIRSVDSRAHQEALLRTVPRRRATAR
jgi:hypothetical protein